MGESIFGSGFDLRDYVHKRALEINNLEERTRLLISSARL